MNAPNLDTKKMEAFGEKMVSAFNQSAVTLMTSIGHRTGLFDVMAQLPPSTTQQIAEAAHLSERYVREWLGAMVTGGIVEHNEEQNTFFLPPEHAALLTRSARPNNLAVTAQWFAVLGHVEDHVVEAFQHGRGVPYSKYHRFHEVMAEESDQTAVAGMETHILPMIPQWIHRLKQGIDVLDVGCGCGQALIRLAELYPASQFVGYDLSEEGIAQANKLAEQKGLKNIRFEVRDVAALQEAKRFDLITAFDAIHDQAKPAEVLHNVRKALRPYGLFLMQDIGACSHLQDNRNHPLGPFLYTISCMHCMSVSLANGGPGLGAVWGKELAMRMLDEAGFQKIEVKSLPHDALNYYYICPV